MQSSDIVMLPAGRAAGNERAAPRAAGANPALIRRVNQLYHDAAHTHFDLDHRRRHRVEAPFWARVCTHVLKAARDASTPLIAVDLACGTGFVPGILSETLRPQDRVLGFDLSRGAIGRAASKIASARCTPGYCAGDISRLPLRAGSVDLVTLNAALHHVPDPGSVLREVDRVLRPAGWFALGFEPNRVHFTSLCLPRVARAAARCGWYLSPAQNRRRVRQMLGADRCRGDAGATDSLDAINRTLVNEGLVASAMSPARLLDLVDPFARGTSETGFDIERLLAGFPGYHVRLLMTSDYLGESFRTVPLLRSALDRVLRCIAPRHGSLFSWLIRKPGGGA